MVNIRLRNIQDWLFPGNCLLCAARRPAGQDLCPACAATLPRLEAACPHCAAPLGAPVSSACGACQQRAPFFDAAAAVFRYAAPVDRLIQDLKYHKRLALARLLGGYLADQIVTQDGVLPDVIVPVPLHVTRLRERGYNQSLELARVLAKRLSLPLEARTVLRVRATASQTRLSPDARQRNVRDAFRTEADFSGRRVAIVDDVMTSGHTVNALARCLRRAGATGVVVWVVARA